jgi:hypothetical protein
MEMGSGACTFMLRRSRGEVCRGKTSFILMHESGLTFFGYGVYAHPAAFDILFSSFSFLLLNICIALIPFLL